jgi:uncharacterized membrane protein
MKRDRQGEEYDPEHYAPERINAFSDGVFAIIITIMVLELKQPSRPTLGALVAEWPTWISYITSYIFIAVVWINHHYVFLLVNITYLLLIRETISTKKTIDHPNKAERLFHVRSVSTLLIFGSGMIVALWHPYIGFGIICASLAFYVRPDVPGMKK